MLPILNEVLIIGFLITLKYTFKGYIEPEILIQFKLKK